LWLPVSWLWPCKSGISRVTSEFVGGIACADSKTSSSAAQQSMYRQQLSCRANHAQHRCLLSICRSGRITGSLSAHPDVPGQLFYVMGSSLVAMFGVSPSWVPPWYLHATELHVADILAVLHVLHMTWSHPCLPCPTDSIYRWAFLMLHSTPQTL
jgi:hypothetical protein